MRRLLALALGLVLLTGGPAGASFSGPFAPANWSLLNANADGFVDSSGAPGQIVLTGGNNFSNSPGLTTFTIAFPTAVAVSFSWQYGTVDLAALDDPAGYVLNGVLSQLTDNAGSTSQSGGPVTIDIAAGDVFGWYVATSDNLLGRASLTVSDFAVRDVRVAVPAPGALAILGMGLLGLAALRRREA